MDHHPDLQKMSSAALMLPKDEGEERVVIITPSHQGVGKVLIREDTILANIQGCTNCGKVQFNCSGVHKQWSALCWGKHSEKKSYCLLVSLSTAFVLSLIATIFLCFTDALNDAILSSMVLRNNSLPFEMWKRPAVQPLMKVHVFNYTNVDRFIEGLDPKLKVEDVGPFVYAQQLERVNIKFEDDRLSYQESNTFTYLPEKSAGVQYEQVYVPNLPLIGVSALASNYKQSSWSNSYMSSLIELTLHPTTFNLLPVQRFLWGYDDPLINLAKPFLAVLGKLNFEKFGLLVTKNGTSSDHITINTGEYDKDKMNMIELFNNKEHLTYWSDIKCNSIEGSDGTMFPPSLVDRETSLNVFFPNLCRRLKFEYEKDVESQDGIQLLRYRMPSNVFDDPEHNPANQCFCEIDSGTCPPRGVINVTACNMGMPLLVSFPHFYLGEPSLLDAVEGLHPDPALHSSHLDIHPKLGISLDGRSSLQLNVQVKKTEGFKQLSFLKQDMILPIAWLEMAVEELPQQVKTLVYHGTYSTVAVQLGLTVVSVLTLVISGIGLMAILVFRRPKPCVTLKKIPIEIKGSSSRL